MTVSTRPRYKYRLRNVTHAWREQKTERDALRLHPSWRPYNQAWTDLMVWLYGGLSVFLVAAIAFAIWAGVTAG